MARYEIVVHTAVFKDLDRIPKKDAQRIVKAIRALAREPHPPQSMKLSGDEIYRLRCDKYRILYEILDDKLVIYVVRVRHRKDVYR